jgi:hypothetical protein
MEGIHMKTILQAGFSTLILAGGVLMAPPARANHIGSRSRRLFSRGPARHMRNRVGIGPSQSSQHEA